MNDADFTYDTQTEADQGEALAKGAMYPERAWISTDRDVWHPNPFYTGPAKPHPEMEPCDEPCDPTFMAQLEAERRSRGAGRQRDEPQPPGLLPVLRRKSCPLHPRRTSWSKPKMQSWT
jgi:hypothetical protein